jgi:hypothetical protein
MDNMVGITVFSALDLVDGYYQILMRDTDIPLMAVIAERHALEMAVLP